MKIRPSSRHIFAIGRDLINDKRSAIIELVKNAYDADSEIVNIKISSFKEKDDLKQDRKITAKTVVNTRKEYIKKGANKVDLKGFDTKK